MKMNHSLPILALAVLPFAGALNAQDSKPFDAGVALALATDNLKEITNSGGFGGVNLDIGFNTKLAGTTVPLRLSLGINDFPGQSNNGVKTSLLGYQLAADIFIQAGSPNCFLVTGISINKWSMSKSPEPAGYSSSVKGPGLSRTRSGIATLPRSWRRPPMRTDSRALPTRPSAEAVLTARSATRKRCCSV